MLEEYELFLCGVATPLGCHQVRNIELQGPQSVVACKGDKGAKDAIEG